MRQWRRVLLGAGEGHIRIGLIADTVILQEVASRIARVLNSITNHYI